MNILFMCVANSARSQMAQGLAVQTLPKHYHIQSAGSQPSGRVHPMALQYLQENQIDVSTFSSKGISDLPPDFLKNLDFVISLCAEEVCPNILSLAKKIRWSFPDPAKKGVLDNIEDFRAVGEGIRKRLMQFANENPTVPSSR